MSRRSLCNIIPLAPKVLAHVLPGPGVTWLLRRASRTGVSWRLLPLKVVARWRALAGGHFEKEIRVLCLAMGVVQSVATGPARLYQQRAAWM